MSEPERETEAPCEATGGPCVWFSEEWYDADGELESWDLYCDKCFRWRDWSKEEMVAADSESRRGEAVTPDEFAAMLASDPYAQAIVDELVRHVEL